MAGPRFHRVLLTTLAALVVCAALVPARAGATEESADAADDGAITTVLQPGWNMVGWLGGDVPASDLFEAIPALVRVSAWDAEEQRYQRRTRTSIARYGLRELTPGRGLWLLIGDDEPVEWTRPASEDSMLLELRAGRNLVGWAGRNGTSIEEAIERFGDTFIHAWMWDASAKRFLHFHPGRESTNPLRELNHGDALWVELTGDARWWQSGTAPPPVVFFGRVEDERQSEIRESVDSARAVFAERWGVEVAPTIYVGDPESIRPTYLRILGQEPPGACGVQANYVVFVFCFDEDIVAHEYFHALQHDLSAGRHEDAPTWIVEGSAVYADVVYAALSVPTMSLRSQLDEYADRQVSQVIRHTLPPLEETEEHFHSLPGNLGYPLGFLAVDLLVERAGEQSILDFFAALPSVERWPDAFNAAFGLTDNDFYEQFEAYRAKAAPPLPHLTDDRDAPVLVFVGDVPTATRNAARAELDSVQAFFRDRFGEPSGGDYTLYLGANARALDDVYRLVVGRESTSYCSRVSSPGTVFVTSLECRPDLARWHGESVVFNLTVGGLPIPRAGYPWRGPAWLTEGSYSYASGLYQDAAGSEDLHRTRSRQVDLAVRTRQPLISLATSAGFADGFPASRALGFLAVEWLADRAGDRAIFEYYRALTESETWEEAFEAAFGLTVDDFYQAFEEYRAEVAPPNEGASSS